MTKHSLEQIILKLLKLSKEIAYIDVEFSTKLNKEIEKLINYYEKEK